jgi:hypothetical protein
MHHSSTKLVLIRFKTLLVLIRFIMLTRAQCRTHTHSLITRIMYWEDDATWYAAVVVESCDGSFCSVSTYRM